jgi:HK97 gp10 family phage protein
MQTVEGIDQLDKDIQELCRNISGKELERITRVAGGEILQEVALRAPVKTGALKASIESFARSKESWARSTVHVANSKKGGVKWYAVLLEYGTSKMSAKPFMRPAFDMSKDRAVERFTTELEKVIKAK